MSELRGENLFSIVITVEDGENVNETLESIYKRKLEGSVQVILAVCTEEIESVKGLINNKYKEQVEFVRAKSSDILDVYEAAAQSIQGKFVSFITETMYYSENTLHLVEKQIKNQECKIYSIQPVYLDVVKGEKAYPIAPGTSGIYNVIEKPENMQMFFSGYFISAEILDTLGFSSTVCTEKEKDFLIRCFLKYKTYSYIEEAVLYFRDSAESEFATNMIQYKKEWYLEDGRNFLLKWVKKAEKKNEEKARFIQSCILYLLFARYNCNTNDRNKKILDDTEIQAFMELSQEILKYIPEQLILKKRRTYTIPRWLKFFFIRIRCQALECEFKIAENGINYFLEDVKQENKVRRVYNIARIKSEKIVITAINYKNNMLELDIKSNLADYFEAEDIKITALYNEQEAAMEQVECYPLIKSFGKTVLRRVQYRVMIPVKERSLKLGFYIELNGKQYIQTIAFSGAASRLTSKYKKSYWNFDENRVLVHNGSRKFLYVKTVKNWRMAGRELKLLWDMRKSQGARKSQTDADRKEMLKTRLLYHVLKPFYRKKRIWVSFDKLYKGGDNGEYMYHYLKENQPDIEPYYIVNKDAPDYERLKSEGRHILVTNSRRCRVISLFAETILATHTTVWTYCGFTSAQQEYVRDLLNAKIVCIQHGLTVQKIAQYQNRLFDNTLFYCCASQCEVENILKPIYGYKEEDVVLTGLARYDGLKNNDKKQILITPTWRRDIVNNGIACVKKTHNAHFKDSVYFNIYNNLINNKKLIETAKETGYQIIYMLHPAMSAQSVDFTRNDYVQILEAAGDMSYEKILTESSLMVTDYSGVQFDFAYMRKPVVYYHPDTLPPFYEESVFKYESMGFGEICEKEEKLVELLCEYMKNQCKCKEFYEKRANEFFAFDDYQSCERIYHAVEGFLKKK